MGDKPGGGSDRRAGTVGGAEVHPQHPGAAAAARPGESADGTPPGRASMWSILTRVCPEGEGQATQREGAQEEGR